MSQELDDLKERFDRQLAGLSRQSAHSMMDLDAAIAVLENSMRGKICALEKRVSELEEAVKVKK